MSQPVQTLFGVPVTVSIEVAPGEVLIAGEGALVRSDDGRIEVNPDAVHRLMLDWRLSTPGARPTSPIRLDLNEGEAHDVHHALSIALQLLEEVNPPAHAALTRASRPRLATVARRLDHERRWKGTRPNPNRPL